MADGVKGMKVNRLLVRRVYGDNMYNGETTKKM